MYLVFDVGGTFVKYAWMNVDGNIQEKGKYPTPTREGESVPEFVESLGQIYDRYKDQGVEGIALSLPGLIDTDNGIIRNGGSIKYLKDAHHAGYCYEWYGDILILAIYIFRNSLIACVIQTELYLTALTCQVFW